MLSFDGYVNGFYVGTVRIGLMKYKVFIPIGTDGHILIIGGSGSGNALLFPI